MKFVEKEDERDERGSAGGRRVLLVVGRRFPFSPRETSLTYSFNIKIMHKIKRNSKSAA